MGWFGIGQSSIDAGLMVGEWRNLFRGIAKDIAGVVGSASTIISVITAIMPDPEGEAKQKWDKFLASYVDDRGEAIDGTRKDIKLIRSRKVTLKKYAEQRGPIIVFGVKARVKETTELSYINKDGKEIRELIKEEIWDEY